MTSPARAAAAQSLTGGRQAKIPPGRRLARWVPDGRETDRTGPGRVGMRIAVMRARLRPSGAIVAVQFVGVDLAEFVAVAGDPVHEACLAR